MVDVGLPTDGREHSGGRHPGGPSDDAAILAVLNDETNCRLLAATTEDARSVPELAAETEKSTSTIYRHIQTLQTHGLVAEGTELDRAGHHRSVFRTAVRRVEIEFADEAVTVTLEHRDDAVDRIARLWTQIRGED